LAETGELYEECINNLESPFLDEEILERWVGVNCTQVAALGPPTVGVSSASGSYSCGEIAVRLQSSKEG